MWEVGKYWRRRQLVKWLLKPGVYIRSVLEASTAEVWISKCEVTGSHVLARGFGARSRFDFISKPGSGVSASPLEY